MTMNEIMVCDYIYNCGLITHNELEQSILLDELGFLDSQGKWIYKAGRDWIYFNYEKGLEFLIYKDYIGEWIYLAGKDWDEFDYEKGLKEIAKKDIYNLYYKLAIKNWPKEFTDKIKNKECLK